MSFRPSRVRRLIRRGRRNEHEILAPIEKLLLLLQRFFADLASRGLHQAPAHAPPGAASRKHERRVERELANLSGDLSGGLASDAARKVAPTRARDQQAAVAGERPYLLVVLVGSTKYSRVRARPAGVAEARNSCNRSRAHPTLQARRACPLVAHSHPPPPYECLAR